MKVIVGWDVIELIVLWIIVTGWRSQFSSSDNIIDEDVACTNVCRRAVWSAAGQSCCYRLKLRTKASNVVGEASAGADPLSDFDMRTPASLRHWLLYVHIAELLRGMGNHFPTFAQWTAVSRALNLTDGGNNMMDLWHTAFSANCSFEDGLNCDLLEIQYFLLKLSLIIEVWPDQSRWL